MRQAARIPALASLACLTGFVVSGVLAGLVPVHEHDVAALGYFTAWGGSEWGGPREHRALDWVAHLADPGAYAVFAVAIVIAAFLRGRLRLAGSVGAVLLAAPLTTTAIKHVSNHPSIAGRLADHNWFAFTWPSGHATASATVAMCAVLAAPPVLRPLVGALGLLFAGGVAVAILALRWHFPSDVVGGYLCAAMWTLAAVALLRAFPQRRAHTVDARGAEPV